MFCPNGSNTTGVIPAGTYQTYSLTGINPEAGAIRISYLAGDILYAAFASSASASDILITGNNPEVFKIPVGVTDISIFNPSGAGIVSVTIGQKV